MNRRLSDLGERGLIAALLARLPEGTVPVGPGLDDAAAWRDHQGRFEVFTCDAAVEGVHFDPATQSAHEIGWRALALALGDIAAMGARPSYATITLAAPPEMESSWLEELYQGLADLSLRCGLEIVGGDTVASPGPLFLSTAILGSAAKIMRRDTAEEGWYVAITGPLGGPERRWAEAPQPVPRIAAGQVLASSGVVCAGDISDGLWAELARISKASGCGFEIEAALVPVVSQPGRDRQAALDRALAWGEEVELVCVAPLEALDTAMGELEGQLQLAVIGRCLADGMRLLAADGSMMAMPKGYEHFGGH